MLGKNWRKRSLIASTTIAVSALVASALPAQAADPGITATTIKLGITLPLTGAASPGYNKIPAAMQAYFNYVNDNGGVNGRKVQLVVKDDSYLPTLAVAKTNDLILKDKVFATVGQLGTANNEAIASSVNLGRRGIPSLFINTGFSGFANSSKYPTTYPILASYAMEAKIMGAYIKENYAGKKVFMIYQDDDFGSDALAGFKQAGLTFDSSNSVGYASGSQSLDTAKIWLGKAAAYGADVTIMFGVSNATGPALAAYYGLKGAFKTQWILGSVGGDATTLKAIGVPASVLYGAIGASSLPSPADAADPYVAQFQTINTKYNAGAAFDNNVLLAMNTAMLTVQALRAAGTNPTRAALMAAISSKGASWANAGLAPLNYGASSHVGYNGYWFGTYGPTGTMLPAGGKYVVYTTDSGSGAVVKSTYVRPAMPAKGLPNN